MASRFVAFALAASIPIALHGQQHQLTVERIFGRGEFAAPSLPSIQWLADGRSYVELRENPRGGTDIVRVDIATGTATTLIEAADISLDDKKPIAVEELILGQDENQGLLFHDTERVWRRNTKGTYHLLDFRTKKLIPISPNKGFQLFAKLSPAGQQVAFVRGNNLYVTDLATGAERALTNDGSENIINGTTDWVYEEELDLRDAFRWAPDGQHIAYWRFDQSGVPAFPMVNETDSLYPRIQTLRYPKAGERNSRVKVGVVHPRGGNTVWIDAGADTGIYIARMEWLGADSLVVQVMPRRQNKVVVIVASAATGKYRPLLTETDSAYVDIGDEPLWLTGNRQFLWVSDRTGWRQVFLYDRSGRVVRQVTRDSMDVLSINALDERNGWLYVTAAAPDPTQRNVYRFSLDGKRSERVTKGDGTHSVTISPGARYLVDTYSTINSPPGRTLYELPSLKMVRVLAEPTKLRDKLASLKLREPQFMKVPMPDGLQLDAYRIVPADFDSTKKHPVLMFVYGGPAAPQVNNTWLGNRYLWHQMLAQKGYIVMVVDNRGAAWRGRDFRKTTQLFMGLKESQDQIDAAKWIGRQTWADASRIGIWGWSYGGFMTALTTARGGDVFRAGISVAPVTDWRYYDTIYTERFMWIPRENAAGYTQTSVMSHVDSLKAMLLLVHGTGDDNVHPQNTTALVNKLIEKKKPFYELMYPNRTHSISGGSTQAHLYGMFTRFLDEQLAGTSTPQRLTP